MIGLQIDEKVALLTIDRPDKANSLTAKMLRELTAKLEDLAVSDCRAVILTGAGRVFSAGADLDEARNDGLAKSPEWERLSARMVSMPCLTVAALNGTLAGGAFGMVLACDLRLAVPEAKFFYPVMKLGFLPQPSDPRRLAALIGPARAKMILMAGARIDAAEARDWGLIDRIVPAEELNAAATGLAADCTAASADHVAAIKEMTDQP
ncbi:enoyl-CoA hydratase/isomerase family protein [Paracoccus onubensis]|uniref:Enoyl-CoA hydratase/isomerase family protein n=1 Tax=Paracoccus onubensis TaxID=1675788 RepID=A0A418SNC3_9RHOB|nr:enoyl-CoA hydratase/isomerase family protein [Paracoccus onubensis]RJE82471.1 enoyl-CoA hydratase/isomerase family protein [Paracoccus onubensis]